MKKLVIMLITSLLLSIWFSNKVFAQETVEVFFNDACKDCVTYIREMEPLLSKYDLKPVLKDYINKPSYRKELNALNKRYQIPYSVQDSLTFFKTKFSN